MNDEIKPGPTTLPMPKPWYDMEIRRHRETRDAEIAFVEQIEGWHRRLGIGQDAGMRDLLGRSRRVIADFDEIIARLKAESGL